MTLYAVHQPTGEAPPSRGPAAFPPVGTYEHDEKAIQDTLADGRARLHVYRLDAPAVVMGRGADPAIEVRASAILDDNVSLLRRRGGGCSVVIDPGNVIVALTMKRPGFGSIAELNREISQWLIAGLDAAGVPDIHLHGHSDLVADGRKIAGACLYRAKDLAYYATTLLVDPDIDMMERYLPHPPREPTYRQGRSHGDFVGSLKTQRGITDINAFIQRLQTALTIPPQWHMSD